MSQSSNQGKKVFTNEAKLLTRVQHRNVVNLLGYCVHSAEKLFMYEYVANESLDKLLFIPAIAPSGGVGNGNNVGSTNDDTNDDDLGIMDIDDNDNKTGKNSSELAELNESLQELLDGIQHGGEGKLSMAFATKLEKLPNVR
ncbi:putative cysteine-rich receptor-like protein kinase 35 [Camellia lanceoleosa]|uniref:Cysteine-rich receptor-like protein kinase 35 n=1 Tax=Camellia lanceoleosa TaxID=1840588 RepID=A0ACC0J562_9ERIC|nr:putative cysteine-rich receptor-like protein kinase 35 [Camellia lanceoleosa]